MKVLFLTRDWPPQVGGRAVFSYNFNKNLKNKCDLKTIYLKTKGSSIKKEWSYPKWALKLMVFFPIAFFKALLLNRKEKFDFIILGDCFFLLTGLLLKKLTKARLLIFAHGIDLVHSNKIWQLFLRKNLRKMDKVIVVSNALKKEALKKDVPDKKCIVFFNSINKNEFFIKKPKKELVKKLPKEIKSFIKGKRVLLSVGRFVRRKGFNWFASNVMPRLKNHCYLIVGDGPEMDNIKDTIEKKKLEQSIKPLGIVSKELLKLLFNTSDVFIMPNIKFKQEMEGFGIVVIEAGSCGLPVVASNLDGIKDAVIDNKTGFLVKHENVNAFIKGIKNVNKLNKLSIRKQVIKNFDWSNTSKKFIETLESLKD